MKALNEIAMILVVVGALNWLLHALSLNLVDMLLGSILNGVLATVVYALVGLSGAIVAYNKWLSE